MTAPATFSARTTQYDEDARGSRQHFLHRRVHPSPPDHGRLKHQTAMADMLQGPGRGKAVWKNSCSFFSREPVASTRKKVEPWCVVSSAGRAKRDVAAVLEKITVFLTARNIEICCSAHVPTAHGPGNLYLGSMVASAWARRSQDRRLSEETPASVAGLLPRRGPI